MTLDQFFSDMSRVKLNFTWKIIDGSIRGIKIVNKKEVLHYPSVAHYRTCNNTGICDIQRIVDDAADKKQGYDPLVRKQLLETLNIEE